VNFYRLYHQSKNSRLGSVPSSLQAALLTASFATQGCLSCRLPGSLPPLPCDTNRHPGSGRNDEIESCVISWFSTGDQPVIMLQRVSSALQTAGDRGYGTFVRRMRDIGFDFFWHDPYSKNLMARGVEFAEQNPKIEKLTVFEAFEHFADPLSEIQKMLSISRNILFSTCLLPEPVPSPEKWSYYSFKYGQHVSFYSNKTIEYIADKFCLNYHQFIPNIHLLTEKKISPKLVRFLTNRIINKILTIYVFRKMSSRTYSDFDAFV